MISLDKKIRSCYNAIYPICPKIEVCNVNKDPYFSIKPKMPYIGRNYGRYKYIPKILFVSLDSGDYQENLTTIDEIRIKTESEPPLKIYKKESYKHWYQTFDIAKHILDGYLDESLKSYHYYSDSYISHTNSAKCTQDKVGRAQADDRLFCNCKDFVAKEIPLFEADIIITQGKKGLYAMNTFPKLKSEYFRSIHNGRDVSLEVLIREINGKKSIHIPMYHPRYYRGYWSQKKALVDNLELLKGIYYDIQ